MGVGIRELVATQATGTMNIFYQCVGFVTVWLLVVIAATILLALVVRKIHKFWKHDGQWLFNSFDKVVRFYLWYLSELGVARSRAFPPMWMEQVWRSGDGEWPHEYPETWRMTRRRRHRAFVEAVRRTYLAKK